MNLKVVFVKEETNRYVSSYDNQVGHDSKKELYAVVYLTSEESIFHKLDILALGINDQPDVRKY